MSESASIEGQKRVFAGFFLELYLMLFESFLGHFGLYFILLEAKIIGNAFDHEFCREASLGGVLTLCHYENSLFFSAKFFGTLLGTV